MLIQTNTPSPAMRSSSRSGATQTTSEHWSVGENHDSFNSTSDMLAQVKIPQDGLAARRVTTVDSSVSPASALGQVFKGTAKGGLLGGAGGAVLSVALRASHPLVATSAIAALGAIVGTVVGASTTTLGSSHTSIDRGELKTEGQKALFCTQNGQLITLGDYTPPSA